jgi:hypothetical protein
MLARVLARALTTLVVASVLALVAFSGRAFLWCAAMQEARAHCCCSPFPQQGSMSRADRESPTVDREPCCVSKAVGETPVAASSDSAPSLGAVAHVVEPIAPAPPANLRFAATDFRLAHRFVRGSPPPRGPPHRLHCVYLI